MVGLEFKYVVSRHKVITLKIDQPYQPGWPIVKDLTTPDKLYFRPETGGLVLIGTGDHGDPIKDPDTLTDDVDLEHVDRIGRLIASRMPSFNDADYVAGWTGPYDITPDWNPLVGEVPGHEGLYVAVGFSGHGFKLAPTIGEGLAQTVLGMEARVPVDVYAPPALTKARRCTARTVSALFLNRETHRFREDLILQLSGRPFGLRSSG
jgi:sarcosine oxidase subunit beta